jgi:hypothetical protein
MRPTLTVVGSGTPEPDIEKSEMIARGAERMAAADVFWLLTGVDGEVSCAFYGGQLEASVLAETVAADMKREAVGL